MKPNFLLLLLSLTTVGLSGFIEESDWIREDHKQFTLVYTHADLANKTEYVKLIDNGLKSVHDFFGSTYPKTFDVYIHANRQSLDQKWRKDWGMPDFKSECWMVASGVALKLDMISPKNWDKEACEHSYIDNVKTQRLVTHELFHVYHGQFNASPDFSDVDNIDWFVEGLATYASGQCDAERMIEVRKLALENQTPSTLNDFWKGKLKYGLSGSAVMYIDSRFGRNKLKELLTFNKKADLLSSLQVTEEELLKDWKTFITNYSSKK